MRDCFGHVTSCQEAGRGRGLETMETSGCSRIMWETRWRVMCTYLLCVSFSFEGFPLNGNFRDNNVNVYTLYCHRFEHVVCLLPCRQRKRCHVEQCGAVYLNRLLSFRWKFTLIRSTRLESFQRDHGREREYGWLANQAVGNIGVFCLTVAENVQWARKTNFVFGMRNWKNILFWQDTRWKNERSSFP